MKAFVHDSNGVWLFDYHFNGTPVQGQGIVIEEGDLYIDDFVGAWVIKEVVWKRGEMSIRVERVKQ